MRESVLPPALFSPLLLLLLLFLLASAVSAVPHNFKQNYRDPTPSPEDGPSASYHASRNRNILPYEICGIVGGYVFTVIIWAVLLLTVGRKMRRKALERPRNLELELQDKSIWANELASPPLSAVSVRSTTSWFRKFRRSESGDSSPLSPVLSSPTSFDQNVINAQRDQAQADMERLYAAVMDHDEQKHLSQSSQEPPVKATARASTSGRERKRPSALSIARSQDSVPESPVIAVYPPNYEVGPSTTVPYSQPRPRTSEQRSPRSILSKRSQASSTPSGNKSARFNLKNLLISGPIPKYPGESSNDDARTPLSPRLYNPGSPPSPPTQANSPITPFDPSEALDTVQPLPRAAPQRLNRATKPNLTITPPPPPVLPYQQQRDPQNQPPSSLQQEQQQHQHHHHHHHQQQHNQPSSLPLRSFAQPLASPSIQTTILSRHVESLSLGTPKTGVPFTPYSPYMPFTPITPVTPSHLVSRKDRKAGARSDARRRGLQREREMVQTPREIFGDAY